jgi:spermidine/putrescine transport system permease protein
MEQKRQRSIPLAVYFTGFLVFLYLPIALLVLFSFNNSPVLVFPLKGFTTRWYEQLLQAGELKNAVVNSLVLGLVSSLVATILGTMAAIGIVRFNFRGKGVFLGIASLPLVIPYVVLGVALLILFNQLGVHLSLLTVGLGHVIINVPFVMLVVAARLAGFDNSLEEAAMDLGANYWVTLARVTLPIAMPALLASFLMCFTTSFDEFALSFFLIGNETTLPIYLYSQLRFPSRLPLVVTLAAIIMVASIVVIIFSEWLRRFGKTDAPSQSVGLANVTGE